MPVNMHGPYTDSPLNDCQAGIENTYFSLMPAMAGADILTGAGHLQGGLVVNFTQLVMDDELIGLVNRAIQGLEVDEENLGFEAVQASIETDNLLMHPHTLRHHALRPLPHKIDDALGAGDLGSGWLQKHARPRY